MESHDTGRDETPNAARSASDELASSAATVNARRAVKAKHIVTVHKPAAQIFSVAHQWVSALPDVEIVNEKPDAVVAWKTARDSKVSHAGSVNLHETADGVTEVRIEIDYEPPGVAFGTLFDRLTSTLMGTR